MANHFHSSEMFQFLFRFQHGCTKAWKKHWQNQFIFLVFNGKCTLFGIEKNKFTAKKGLSDWYEVNEKVSKHINKVEELENCDLST